MVMIMKIAKSMVIAFRVAVIGFKRAFFDGETKDSILGYVDCLTNLPNRKAFERDKRAAYEGYSLVMVDIDNLKNINDTQGHCFGDKIIQGLASILKVAAGRMGKIDRYAGDEFVCIIPREEAKSFCGEIRGNAKKHGAFTVSQGVIMYLDNGMIADALVQADITMYKSKMRGRDRITIAPQFIVRENESRPFPSRMWLDKTENAKEHDLHQKEPKARWVEGITFG
jgi:diguanylate cyclase (GGDEF)-like protein